MLPRQCLSLSSCLHLAAGSSVTTRASAECTFAWVPHLSLHRRECVPPFSSVCSPSFTPIGAASRCLATCVSPLSVPVPPIPPVLCVWVHMHLPRLPLRHPSLTVASLFMLTLRLVCFQPLLFCYCSTCHYFLDGERIFKMTT